MVIMQESGGNVTFYGLSTDTKPTVDRIELNGVSK